MITDYCKLFHVHETPLVECSTMLNETDRPQENNNNNVVFIFYKP